MPPDTANVMKVPMQTVIVVRDTGKKDAKTKEPVYARVIAEPGVPFGFTKQEVDDALSSSPGCLRDAVNESADAATVAEEARLAAIASGGAPLDAAVTAAEGVTGPQQGANKQAGKGKEASSSPIQVHTPDAGPHEDEETEL